jgi:glycosyltransferase involved in cell wall biosynthesis
MISVIIPTLPDRQNKFNYMVGRVLKQFPQAEILTDDDITKTIGQKRGELLLRATQDYVIQLDDDDNISDDMFETLFKAIKDGNEPDVVCFYEEDYHCGEKKGKVGLGMHTPGIPDWGILPRNLVKTKIARKVGFYDVNNQEDMMFGFELLAFVKNSYKIDKTLYFYYDTKKVARYSPFKPKSFTENPMDIVRRGESMYPEFKKFGRIEDI